ncbi:MAG: hypothetical protein V1735_05725 [Nanoarchaeota archaeon]
MAFWNPSRPRFLSFVIFLAAIWGFFSFRARSIGKEISAAEFRFLLVITAVFSLIFFLFWRFSKEKTRIYTLQGRGGQPLATIVQKPGKPLFSLKRFFSFLGEKRVHPPTIEETMRKLEVDGEISPELKAQIEKPSSGRTVVMTPFRRPKVIIRKK